MPVRGSLEDPVTGRVSMVTDDHSIVVAQSPNAAYGVEQFTRPFVSYLTDASGGSEISPAAGTVAAPEVFSIRAAADADRYVTQIGFVITGNAALLRNFGTGTALSNGCLLRWFSTDGAVQIGGALASNWDFVRLAQGMPAFGDSAAAFRASQVISTEEGYVPVIDFTRFIPPFGLRLAMGSEQRVDLVIQDTISAVNVPNFDALAYGFDRRPRPD